MNNDMALIFFFFASVIYYFVISMSSPNAKIYKDGEEMNKRDKKSYGLLLFWMGVTFLVFGIYFAEDWYRIFGIIIAIILHTALFRSLKSRGD